MRAEIDGPFLVVICDTDFVSRKSRLTRGKRVSVITDGAGVERLAVECENETLFISLYRLDLAAAKIMVPLRPEKEVSYNDGAPVSKNHAIRN